MALECYNAPAFATTERYHSAFACFRTSAPATPVPHRPADVDCYTSPAICRWLSGSRDKATSDATLHVVSRTLRMARLRFRLTLFSRTLLACSVWMNKQHAGRVPTADVSSQADLLKDIFPEQPTPRTHYYCRPLLAARTLQRTYIFLVYRSI